VSTAARAAPLFQPPDQPADSPPTAADGRLQLVGGEAPRQTAERLDQEIRTRAGRRLPFATVGDWVALADIPDKSKVIYWILRAHVNQERGDDRVWPTLDTIGAMVRLNGKERDKEVRRYIRHLERITAVDVETERYGPNRMYKRNVYVVHERPADSYEGFTSTEEWHQHYVPRGAGPGVIRAEVIDPPGLAPGDGEDE
jgi:hypothetical protein